MMFLALALSFHSTWQSKRYLLTLIGAIIVSLPLLILYPLVLSKTNPEWFDIWFNHYSLGVFGGFHQIQTAFNLPYYLKNLLWFALPAWPLAAWTLSRTRIHDKNWGILSLSWLVIMTALLAINPQRLQDNLVWLLPPLALLGAAQLDGLRRGAAAFINWFGIMAFGLIAVFLWLGFFAMNYGWPAKLAERAAYFSPYYIPDIDPIPMTVALLFTPLWLWAITRKKHPRPPSRDQLGSRRYLGLGLADDPVFTMAQRRQKPCAGSTPNGSRTFFRIETAAFRRPRMYQHQQPRPAHTNRVDTIQPYQNHDRQPVLPLPPHPPSRQHRRTFGLANLVARRKTAQQSRNFPIAGKNCSAVNHTHYKLNIYNSLN